MAGAISEADLYRLWLELYPALSSLPLYLDEIRRAVENQSPAAPDPSGLDLSPLLASLAGIQDALRALPAPLPAPDHSELLESLTGAVGALSKQAKAKAFSVMGHGGGATESTLEKLLPAIQALPQVGPETGLAKDLSVNRRFGNAHITLAAQVSASGDNTVVSPSGGKALRVFWVGMSSSQNNAGETLAVVKFAAGGSAKYRWNMGNPGAFSHWETITGAVGEALIVNLSVAYPVECNVTYEEF